jgi:hypothetical protein
MDSILEAMKADVEKTIYSLDSTSFDSDPIAGRSFSGMTSAMSSAYKAAW